MITLSPGSQIRDKYNAIISDTFGKSLVTTDISHYCIHAGRAFIASNAVTVAGTSVYEFILVNTTAYEVHLKNFHFTSTKANATVELFRNVTTTSNGTSIPLNNKKFDSANTAQATLTHTPTGLSTASATQIHHILLVGAKNEGSTSDIGDNEYILKQNEKVLIRYTNNDPGNDDMDYELILLDVGLL